jgi:hypothetical protein
MALTSTTSFDLIGQTQVLTYFNPSQVDQITYSNNQITFAGISSYNLSKSDLILYFQYLNAFNLFLIQNFPVVNQSIGAIWPFCQFDITESSSGVTHLIYTQTSQGNVVYTTNYVPIAQSGSMAARSQVTITLQEYFMMILMKAQFTQQIGLN